MKQSILLPIIALGLMTVPTFSSAQKNHENLNAATENVQGHSPQAKNQTGAIEIILKDHQHIRQMIATLNKELTANTEKSHATYKELKDFLVKHETMEEKLWYPELEKNESLKPIISALIKEETDAGELLKKIDDVKDEKEWESSIKTLSKAVEHHAKEEETKLFPKVKHAFDKATLDSIGAKLKEYHDNNNMKY